MERKVSKFYSRMAGVVIFHWVFVLLIYCVDITHSVGENICMEAVCEFTLVLRYTRTMTYKVGRNTYNVELNRTQLVVGYLAMEVHK